MSLIELLPSYYRDNKTMEELQEILSAEVNNIAHGLNETIDQSFVNTATSLLSRYEEIYGIKVDVTKSNEFRRERIRAKIRGVGTVTKQLIIDTAKSYSNGEVEVIEDNVNHRFIIRFIGTLGVPQNMGDLILTVEEIKPAHLVYAFEYIYNTHTTLSLFAHEQLSAYTHQQLREEVIS